jgi:acyl-CoA thioester hydrolase
MDITQFKFRFDLQMRWNDLDALGHVNNAMFITYFETARGRFMLEACPGWDWYKNMFLIAQVHADFQKELLLSAKNPQVLMRTSKIGTKSFELSYAIISEGKEGTVLHATGTTTQIMFDMKTRQTIVIPSWVKENLIAFDA